MDQGGRGLGGGILIWLMDTDLEMKSVATNLWFENCPRGEF